MIKEELEFYQIGKCQNIIDVFLILFLLKLIFIMINVQILIFVILLNWIEFVCCLMLKLYMICYMESSWEKKIFYILGIKRLVISIGYEFFLWFQFVDMYFRYKL